MNKIKNLFSPARGKEDPRKLGEPTGETIPEGQRADDEIPDVLRTDTKEVKRDTRSHGVLRQILDPGNKKYSEESYGTTAHAAEDATNVGDEAQAATTAEQSNPEAAGKAS